MLLRTIALSTIASVVMVSGTLPGLAQNKRGPTKCSSILAVCLQRAGGQAGICEDMYARALTQGQWQATEEPDGTKHAAVACTK